MATRKQSSGGGEAGRLGIPVAWEAHEFPPQACRTLA